MRVSSFWIMSAFWLKLLIFVSSCGPYFSSAEIIHFSDEDTIKINFEMINMGKATHYKIFEHHINGSPLSSEGNIASTRVKATYKQLMHKNNVDIFIFLYKNESNCEQKKVAELRLHNKTRDAAPINSCLTTKGCILEVNWENRCDSHVEQSAPIERPEQNTQQSKEIHHTIKIIKGINTPDQEETYNEGTNLTITCQTDYQSFNIRWVQKKGKNIIMEAVTMENYSSSINLLISRFDDGTTIQCIMYERISRSHSPNQISSGSFNIKVKFEKSKNFSETTMATSKAVVHYFDSTELSCTEVTFKNWIKLSKEGLVESVFTKEVVRLDGDNLKLPLNLNEADNNSDYMCVGVISSPKYSEKCHYFKREIPSLVHLVFSASEKRTAGGLIGYVPVIAGAAGGVIVFLLLVALIIRCASKKLRRPTPHEVETYACPNTVQYVDLQTIPSRRCVTRDDTPYARIVGFLEPQGRRS